MSEHVYMRKYGPGRQVWRVIYPIGVYFIAQGLAVIIALVSVIFIRIGLEGFMQLYSSDPYRLVQQLLQSVGQITLPALALAALVSLPILGMYLSNDAADRREWGVPKPKVSGGVIALSILIGAAACVLGNQLISMANLPQMSDSFINLENMLFSTGLIPEIAVIGVLVPIVEELIYRGLVFRRMRDLISFVPAMVLSAVLFALVHGNLVQGLYAFGVGLLMALVYEFSGSLFASILLHITANTCSVLLTEFPAFSDRPMYDRTWVLISIAVSAAVIVVCVIGIVLPRMARARRGDR